VAEIRSFVVGVVVAGVLLGIVAIALGAFSGDGDESPTARLLGTPPASATARATSGPLTTALPTTVATRPPTTPTAAVTAPATGTAASPTAAPSNTPAPTQNPAAAYISAASVAVTDLGVQIDYLVATGSSNPGGSNQAAGTVKALAGRLQGLSAPACVASGHATLTQGAAAANSGADQLISALSANNQGGISAALNTLSGAKGTLGQGAAAIANAAC
jgi:hypothetical protein